MDDPYYLQRFVIAQDRDGTYDRAVDELRRSTKETHWMWFVFPQIAGLGQSATSKQFAISSLGEAKAYLTHAVLGPRLLECVDLVLKTPDANPDQIFGEIDALKLHSSMTLFLRAAPDESRVKLGTFLSVRLSREACIPSRGCTPLA